MYAVAATRQHAVARRFGERPVAMQALGGAWATEFGLGSAATIINRRMHVRSELTVRFFVCVVQSCTVSLLGDAVSSQ